jgi:hypothetical protein
MSIAGNTFDFIERCEGYRTSGELLDDLLSRVRPFGFEHLFQSGAPVARPPEGEPG